MERTILTFFFKFSESEVEEDERCYMVKIKENPTEFCLIVSEASIREKDNGK